MKTLFVLVLILVAVNQGMQLFSKPKEVVKQVEVIRQVPVEVVRYIEVPKIVEVEKVVEKPVEVLKFVEVHPDGRRVYRDGTSYPGRNYR